MATINFLLRSAGEKKTIYFDYRPNRDLRITFATPYKINSENWDLENQCWDKSKIIKGAKTTATKKQNSEIEKFNLDLLNFKNKIESFIDENLSIDGSKLKILLKNFVEKNYFAHRIVIKENRKDKFPESFSDFVDFYLDFRSVEDKTKGTKPLAYNTIKKYKTLKKVVGTFRKELLVTDINDTFRKNFVKFLNDNNYAMNTQIKFIKDIKTLCKFASKELQVSKDVLHWVIVPNSRIENVSEGVTFTFQQLQKLTETTMLQDSLENAKDWLLISCYTSVRVSELMTFDIANLIKNGDDLFLQVTEKKNINTTGGKKIIYLLPQVVEIMKKRNGNFPRKISDQRYNEYIKKVCKNVGFDEPTDGAKMINNRKTKGVYPFWELVTSHSGRKTYVTLFSEYLPTEILQMQTNHHSKEMVEHYNKTDETELMLRSARLVANAHKEVKLKIV